MGRDASGYFHLVFSLVLALLAGCSTTGQAPVAEKSSAGPDDLMAAVRANEDRVVLELLSRGVSRTPRLERSKPRLWWQPPTVTAV